MQQHPLSLTTSEGHPQVFPGAGKTGVPKGLYISQDWTVRSAMTPARHLPQGHRWQTLCNKFTWMSHRNKFSIEKIIITLHIPKLWSATIWLNTVLLKVVSRELINILVNLTHVLLMYPVKGTEIIYYSQCLTQCRHNSYLFHYLATRWFQSTHVSSSSRFLRTVGTAVQQVSKRGRVDGEHSLIFTHQPQTLILTHQSCAVVLWRTKGNI